MAPQHVSADSDDPIDFLNSLNAQSRQGRISVHGTKLALKTVRPDAVGAEGKALFKRELTIWAALRHPSIVCLNEILDAGSDGWVAAMDWCQGSLRDILNKRQRLSLKEATGIIGDLLDGLAFAYHQDRVLHLDLKPENILYDLDIAPTARNILYEVAGDAQAKIPNTPINKCRFMLADWGIASIKQPQLNAIAGTPPTSQAALRTFNHMGTLLYMAPERFCEGFHSSIASDVFSLGMIYLEMLTGTLPYRQGVHPVESLLTGRYHQDAEVLMSKARVPRSICRQILSMLAANPNSRPNDHTALAGSIARAYKETGSLISKLLN